MIAREHTRDGETERVVVTRGAAGWNVREERDSRVVRQTTYTDWHRVERAVQTFEARGGYSTNR